MRSRVIVAGAGIVGLATAYELSRRGYEVVVVDKERDVAAHQTGHNSGVIHSGLYYRPGSLKAALGTAGARSMREFAQQHGVPMAVTGKLVVATEAKQVPALRALLERGLANGVPVRLIDQGEALDCEPYVQCVAALRVESTGIIDFPGVCRALAHLLGSSGAQISFQSEVVGVAVRTDAVTVTTPTQELSADYFVNCAGLHADRVARLAGLQPDIRIVPFRGEYYELTPDQSFRVRGLIYPVPDPALPFLGVHLTRTLHGGVHAGPNAVLALAREGYSRSTIDLRDLGEYARWPGLYRLGARFWRTGLAEVWRSGSRRRFLAGLRRLVPSLPEDCLVPSPSGVRAQAVARDGALVEDFVLERAPRQVHVLNAPSPAATAALEIARHLAGEIDRTPVHR